jgi:hypothetical protein
MLCQSGKARLQRICENLHGCIYRHSENPSQGGDSPRIDDLFAYPFQEEPPGFLSAEKDVYGVAVPYLDQKRISSFEMIRLRNIASCQSLVWVRLSDEGVG